MGKNKQSELPIKLGYSVSA